MFAALRPILGVQRYVSAPLTVIVVDVPRQIVRLPITERLGGTSIVTVALLETAEHPPLVTSTVYVPPAVAV
jgi:hypothetical protein